MALKHYGLIGLAALLSLLCHAPAALAGEPLPHGHSHSSTTAVPGWRMGRDLGRGLGYSNWNGSYYSWRGLSVGSGIYVSSAYYLPPVVIPSEQLFGPLPVLRMMGVQPEPHPVVDPLPDPLLGLAADLAPDPAPARRAPPKVSAAAREKALRIIQQGDQRAAQGDFKGALSQYRLASDAAPGLAESALREGIARLALMQYDAASWAMHRAAFLQPELTKISVSLDQVLGKLAKGAVIEGLADEVAAHPDVPHHLLTLGVTLAVDGQAADALTILRRCDELGGNEDGVLDRLIATLTAQVNANAGQEF